MTEIDATLAERGTRYGDFSDHAVVAQRLQDVMREQESFSGRRGWGQLDAVKRQALTVIADKIARILNGDAEHADSWRDIAGYATLAEQRCKSQRDTAAFMEEVERGIADGSIKIDAQAQADTNMLRTYVTTRYAP